MLKALGSRLTYANVMATLAVFLALGGGAYALSGIPDRGGVFHGCVNKANGGLRVVKSARSCRAVKKHKGKIVFPGEFAISWNQAGRPGANGINGSSGTNGINGAPGTARAYGFVNAPIVVLCSGTCPVTRSKNVIQVTNPSSGIFCITLAAGIDAAGTGVVAMVDNNGDTTNFGSNALQSFAEWNSGQGDCPAGALEVATGQRFEQSSGGNVTNVGQSRSNSSFFFIVP